jgi:hypothetical protein
MGNINLQITIKEENIILFKRCVRRLLESTFLLREKEEKLYAFLSKESNRQDISDYLRMIGYDILVDEKCELAMLIMNEADADTVGLKRANIVTFSNAQYHLLLVLWEVYLENLGYEEGVFLTRGDLIDKIKSFGLMPVSTELRAAFKLFKKYNLIDYDEEDSSEEAKIRLYPSLQFGWDVPQFKAVAAEYSKAEAEQDKEESAELVDEAAAAGFDEEDEE